MAKTLEPIGVRAEHRRPKILTEDKLALGSGQSEHVNGITFSVQDIVLYGEQKLKDRIGDVIEEGKLIRTMSGASTLEVQAYDPARRLLNDPILLEPYELSVDELGFVFVQAKEKGLSSPLELIHEDALVNRFKQFRGPKKVFRSQMTRAEFIDMLRSEAEKNWGEPIHFVCPALHVVLPVVTQGGGEASEGEPGSPKAEEATALKNRRGGIDEHANVKVKGAAPTPAQRKLGELGLRIAEEKGAPTVVCTALIAALIDENGMNEPNVLQSEGKGTGATVGKASFEITNFLTGGEGYAKGGAIGYAKANPKASPAEIATAMQGNAAGASVYQEWAAEAAEWVEHYGGTIGLVSSSEESALAQGKFAFEVKYKETYWAAMTRLAKEINWAVFCIGNTLYWMKETELIKSKPRMLVEPFAKGVEDIEFEYDVGKKVNRIVVLARANKWFAPPGSVVRVRGLGPVSAEIGSDGKVQKDEARYLVQTIEADLRHNAKVCKVTLARAMKPLAEKAEESSTATAVPEGAAGPVEAMIKEGEKIAAEKLPYVWGGYSNAGYDCSGYVYKILEAGGFVKGRGDTQTLASFGESGVGKFVTIYDRTGSGNPSSEHTCIVIMGQVFVSGEGPPGHEGNGGPREVPATASWLKTFNVKRHPKGY